MLGISVYFQDLDIPYLEEVATIGIDYVFTSLHIPEEDYTSLPEKLPSFLDVCQRNHFTLVPDVSPQTFEMLGIKKYAYESLKEMGFSALRLDYGFDDYALIKSLMKDFDIMLNASVVDEVYLEGAKNAGIALDQIILTHNFYPHKQTGLDLTYFIEKNAIYHRYGMRVQAFVCGDLIKRFPLFEGLPTVEKHRSMHPYVAAVELIRTCEIDDIIIGDSKANLETLRFIKQYMDDNVMLIKVHFESMYAYFYDTVFESRKDLSEHVIRINTPRVANVEVHHNIYRPRGAITMDNRLYGRYSGEVELMKKDYDMDARVNVIGYIHPEFINLLDYIDKDTKIKFVKM